MTCHHYRVTYYSTQASALNSPLLSWSTFAYSALPDHTEYVVGYNSKLQHKYIGFKLTLRKSFHVQVTFYLAVVLLAFTMCVIKFNDFMVTFIEISPPGFNLYICRKEELTFFINCPLVIS